MADDAYGELAAQTVAAGAQISGEAIASKRKNKRAIEWWNMVNEYNSPKASMQRLQEAGLNPNMIYGEGVSGTTGRADSIGTPDKPDYGDALGGVLSKSIGLRQMKAQTDLLNQQIETEKERSRLTSNQADKTFYEAANSNYTDMTNPFVESTLDGMRRRNELLKQQTITQEIDNQIKDRTKAQRVKEIFYAAEKAEKDYEGRELNNQLLKLQRDFLNLGLDRNSPWYAKIFGNILNKTLPSKYGGQNN